MSYVVCEKIDEKSWIELGFNSTLKFIKCTSVGTKVSEC